MKQARPSLPQWNFLASKAQVAVFAGGLGSGKTWALAIKCLEYVSKYPKAVGCIAANTYKQLQDSTLAGMFKAFDELGINYTYKRSDGILQISGVKIFCISLEKYEVHRGKEIGWLLGDEAAYWEKAAYEVIIGRLRDKNGPLEARIATTPNGYNFLFELKESGGDIEFFHATTYQNKHLPKAYIKLLESQYDEKMRLQELEGQFININSGAVYRAFNMDYNVKTFNLSDDDIFKIGTDFNVNPLTSVIGFIRNDTIYIWEEVWIENANTYDLVPKLNEIAPGSDLHPDASGNARKTSSTKSDHQILREAGFNIRCKKANPAIRDRYNCVNGLLHNRRLIIHPRCKKLIRDLRLFTHESKDSTLSHISDALGYLCWYYFPIKRFDSQSGQVRRVA